VQTFTLTHGAAQTWTNIATDLAALTGATVSVVGGLLHIDTAVGIGNVLAISGDARATLGLLSSYVAGSIEHAVFAESTGDVPDAGPTSQFIVRINGTTAKEPFSPFRNGSMVSDFSLVKYASQTGLELANGKLMLAAPYVALAPDGNTEAEIAGMMCDMFVSPRVESIGEVSGSWPNVLATGPDGRIYRAWLLDGPTDHLFSSGTLWIATSN
jgi:hypothetical protein